MREAQNAIHCRTAIAEIRAEISNRDIQLLLDHAIEKTYNIVTIVHQSLDTCNSVACVVQPLM